MAISAAGVGSGLDVNSIVTQLVAIERQPLQQLQTKASTFQSQLSLYGKIKSQASALGDAAALLGGAAGWNTQKASSSNSAAVSVSVSAGAASTSLAVNVQQLARAQSAASVGIPAGTAAGVAGTLTLQLGKWSGTSFASGSAPSVDVAISATDSVATIASKINAVNAGVTATVLKDGTNERLVVRSNTSGEDSGFQIAASGDPGLSMFGFNDTVATSASASGMFRSQAAQNAQVEINGVAIESATNKLTDVVPGVTLQLSQTTAEPVEVGIENDSDAIKKNIQSFVDTYNALSTTLSDATKYDAASRRGGLLQGDATTVGLQNALRSMLGSGSVGSTFSRLSDIGLERQTDGTLKVNSTKLDVAMGTLEELKKLFTTDNGNAATNGFGLKVRDFARGLVAVDGLVSNKSTALQGSIKRNSDDQDRVNDRASRVETQLRRQYTALDAQMAQLNGLNSYVTAQLAQWNKSSN